MTTIKLEIEVPRRIDSWADAQDRYPIQVTMFLKDLWPLFVAQLKAELAEEALSQPGTLAGAAAGHP